MVIPNEEFGDSYIFDKFSESYHGSSASDEGVQQDLLPLIEGTTVHTKYGGPINTDHILFIASGAFHRFFRVSSRCESMRKLHIMCVFASKGAALHILIFSPRSVKPSDMIAELQGAYFCLFFWLIGWQGPLTPPHHQLDISLV